MLKFGVIDPTKVTRSALQNAASIGALFLTTEAVVADKPEKAGPPAMPGAAGTWTSSPQRVTHYPNGGPLGPRSRSR